MKLSLKVAAVICASFIALGGLLYLTAAHIVSVNTRASEKEAAILALQRVTDAIAEQFHSLSRSAADYAAWDGLSFLQSRSVRIPDCVRSRNWKRGKTAQRRCR